MFYHRALDLVCLTPRGAHAVEHSVVVQEGACFILLNLQMGFSKVLKGKKGVSTANVYKVKGQPPPHTHTQNDNSNFLEF